MSRYKLLAMDIDGTLVDSRAEFRPAAREALRRAVDAGLRVVLCTGRRYRTAVPIAQEAGIALPIICHSGALVKNTATHATVYAQPLAGETLELLMASLADFGLTPLAFTDTYEHGTDFYVERDATLTRYHEDYLVKNAGWYAAVGSLRRDLPAPVIQVCTFGELNELRERQAQLRQRLGGLTTCHLLHSAKYLGNFLEFQSGSASKWAALCSLLDSYGIAPDEVVAIGDDENDISMLRAAGLGVAMGNAAPAVKSAAHVVAPSNDDDGVARVIDKLLQDA
jgi:hypothetical protein